jgi:hypothetical protein
VRYECVADLGDFLCAQLRDLVCSGQRPLHFVRHWVHHVLVVGIFEEAGILSVILCCFLKSDSLFFE